MAHAQLGSTGEVNSSEERRPLSKHSRLAYLPQAWPRYKGLRLLGSGLYLMSRACLKGRVVRGRILSSVLDAFVVNMEIRIVWEAVGAEIDISS